MNAWRSTFICAICFDARETLTHIENELHGLPRAIRIIEETAFDTDIHIHTYINTIQYNTTNTKQVIESN